MNRKRMPGKQKHIPASPQQRRSGRAESIAIPIALIFWELLCLAFAFYIIVLLWPGTSFTIDYLKAEHCREVLERVTAASRQQVGRAQALVSRWQIQQLATVSRVDFTAHELQQIAEGLEIAGDLVVNTNLAVTNTIFVPSVTKGHYNTNLSLYGEGLGIAFRGRVRATADTSTTNLTPRQITWSRFPSLPNTPGVRLSEVTAWDLKEAAIRLNEAANRLSTRVECLSSNSGPGILSDFFRKFAILQWHGLDQMTFPITPGERKLFETECLSFANGNRFGSVELDKILFLMAFGVIGAVIRALSSIGAYLGNGRFVSSWGTFYFLRPIIGALLAVVFYFLLGAKLLTIPTVEHTKASATQVAASSTNLVARTATAEAQSNTLDYIPLNISDIVGCCAIALLVGMFSHEATAKLKQVAEGIFTFEQHKDPLESQRPTISQWDIAPMAEFSTDNFKDWEALAVRLKAALTSEPASGSAKAAKR